MAPAGKSDPASLLVDAKGYTSPKINMAGTPKIGVFSFGSDVVPFLRSPFSGSSYVFVDPRGCMLLQDRRHSNVF